MSLTYLKNKVTGELKEIEAGCKEYLELASKRISDHTDDEGNTTYPDQAHRPLWEDRGVAGHAEADEQPAKGNINEREYDDALVGAAPELGIDPDIQPVTGTARDKHAKVANSGTTAEGSQDPNGDKKDEDKESSSGSSTPHSPTPPGAGV